jgi:hypothetical protein
VYKADPSVAATVTLPVVVNGGGTFQLLTCQVVEFRDV